jgi:hypothetical protein
MSTFRIEPDCVIIDFMTKSAILSDISPSATPSEAELAAWASLSREAQISRYRELLAHPDCDAVTNDDMSDILAAARARVAARSNS